MFGAIGWVFLASTDYIALFNLTAHALHELYYDRPTSYKGIGQTPCSFEHVSCLNSDRAVTRHFGHYITLYIINLNLYVIFIKFSIYFLL